VLYVYLVHQNPAANNNFKKVVRDKKLFNHHITFSSLYKVNIFKMLWTWEHTGEVFFKDHYDIENILMTK